MTKTTSNASSSTPLFLIVMAAGSSSRMGGVKKELLPLGNSTVLAKATLPFLQTAQFSAVAVTVPKGQDNLIKDSLLRDEQVQHLLTQNNTQLITVTGGATRSQSVYNALCALQKQFSPSDKALVAIHDGARPFITEPVIKRVLDCAMQYGAAVPFVNAVDTFKQKDSQQTIEKHLVRETLAAVQTPQVFLFKPLLDCHAKAQEQNLTVTDDTEVWDAFPGITGGIKVHLAEGDIHNTKITYQSDLGTTMQTDIHTGLGIDIHRLVSGRKLLLGGVEIAFDKGEDGHSDGDVVLHAITDALLGASGLGDIGSYFPPEDAKWKDADSAQLLKTVWTDIQKQGWTIANLDCVIELEKPKFLPYRQAVCASIAHILNIPEQNVFVKAKTGEGLGSIGQGQAVKATCTCLLYR